MKHSFPVIGIVGTGAMGRGIAQIAAQAGLTVRLFDTNPQAVAAAHRVRLADHVHRRRQLAAVDRHRHARGR